MAWRGKKIVLGVKGKYRRNKMKSHLKSGDFMLFGFVEDLRAQGKGVDDHFGREVACAWLIQDDKIVNAK